VKRLALAAVLALAAACESAGRDGTSTEGSPATGGTPSEDTTPATAADGTASVSASDGGSAASAGVTSEPPAPEFPCTEESECYLHGDCCSCVALHRDQPVPEACIGDCERDACDTWGLTEVLCSHSCLVRLVECDPAMVTCADPPPDCGEGEMPSLEERCWSGHCVPQDLCRPL
jgi:hypothetical protein